MSKTKSLAEKELENMFGEELPEDFEDVLLLTISSKWSEVVKHRELGWNIVAPISREKVLMWKHRQEEKKE